MNPAKPASVLLAAALALLTAEQQPGAPRPDAGVHAVARSMLAERQIPGMSVVVHGPRISVASGYGVTEAGGSRAVDADTVFQLGSIGKQFLAVLVLKLADGGRLSLDDAVTKHLPEFDRLPSAVTVRHLLSHTSGIRELFGQKAYDDGIEDLTRTRAELVDIARASPVDFAPGRRWSYSNTGYTILAFLVERLTGEPYEEALAARIFAPLELRSMRQCTPLPRDAGESRGHVLDRTRTPVPAAPENMNWIRGDGGICGSAHDLARWTRLLHAGEVLPAASLAQMTRPQALAAGRAASYGFALSLIAPDGRRKIAHGGAMLGFTAMAAHYPEDQLTVVVLTNRGGGGADAIERRIARKVLGLPEPVRAPQPLPPDRRREILGSYHIGPFAIRIVERDGELWLESPPPGPSTRLTYIGGNRFAGDRDPDSLELIVDEWGDMPRIRWMMGAMQWYAVKAGR